MSTAERYLLLSHKMQAGVKWDQETDPRKATVHLNPGLTDHFKHERTGINGARVETAALVKLMIEKGVFTEDEWWRTACEVMQGEVDKYETILAQRLGFKVTLDSPFIDPLSGSRRV